MLNAKKSFDSAIIRIRNIHGLYNHLTTYLHYTEETVADILRSEIVYAISAFDKFIHDIVKQGILETYNTLRPATNTYKNFPICMEQMQCILNPQPPANPSQILENIVINNHKYLAFQDPDKITQALSLIWMEEHKWQKIAIEMSANEKDVKTELRNIVIRRNQIVHEGDLDIFTRELQAIEAADVVRSVLFIENLGNSIFKLVKLPTSS